MDPIVSIITPCYNAEQTIIETIESVILQTYTNWEMLIIDDCSTDNSALIIREFVEKDSRIKYYKTKFKSGSPALPRNIGIDNSEGKYVAFLDADDVWLPDKLEKQIQFLSKNNVSFIYSDYEKINYTGNRNNRIVRMPSISSFWDVIETCTIPCLTVMISKEVIGNTRFKNVAKEDFVFWLDILIKNVKAYNTGDILGLYREQSGSRSANKCQMVKDQWRILRHIIGVKPVVAAYFLCTYLVNGLKKYLK